MVGNQSLLSQLINQEIINNYIIQNYGKSHWKSFKQEILQEADSGGMGKGSGGRQGCFHSHSDCQDRYSV